MIKKLIPSGIVICLSVVLSAPIFACEWVNGYQRSDGSFVQGHCRSAPNSTNHDNFSTRGNVNPFTGEAGNVARDYSSGAYSYGGGREIHTGPRGGQYYFNDSGRKVYVPKR